MISSSSAIALAPAHPETTEHQPAAVDHCHPQIEPVAGEEIADQRQRGDADADRDKGVTEPESDDGVDHHEIDRPERVHLPWPQVPHPDRKDAAEDDEQNGRYKETAIEGVHAGTLA